MSGDPIRLVSVSGGKDSTATLLVALEQHPRDRIMAVFADTGNEHPYTYEYIAYLERALGVAVTRLRQDFTDWWWRKRDYTRDHWPAKGVPPEIVARALAVFEKGPTGNPFLDLCIIKARFPSRRAQFCTQYLKTEPMTEHAMDLIDQFGAVESWQGVRADESAWRARLPEREDVGDGLSIYRPILRWDVARVFEKHAEHGIEPNPLYKLGMSRVGCMPCINASKGEIAEIARRFPEHIDRIEEWEAVASQISKRGMSSFFPTREMQMGTPQDRTTVRLAVQWAETTRGGVQRDLLKTGEVPACASSYGLCE